MTALPLISEPVPTLEDAGLGCLATGRGNLPLAAVDIDARVTGLLHATRVRQTFVNPHDEPLEATYIFPLPDRAAVTAFRMEVGDRVVEGVLQERAEARRTYDEAVSQGKRAAIAEEERPNVFTVRVGNLMPGDRASVELMLAGPLALDSGEATWRFPLVVAPRYIPGTPLPGEQVGDGTSLDTDAVPDASRITPPVLLPGFPNPVDLSVRVDLDAAGLPVSDIRCSLPAEIDGTALTVRPGQRLDRDLIVRFTVGAETVGTSLVARDGTFALTLVPPARKHTRLTPRDVVFVLDRSGSMEGWKMTAARRAVARMIDTLGSDDRFAVLAFDNVIEQPSTLDKGLVAAADRLRFRAVEFLATLDARGGTEMLDPLRQGISLLADAQAPAGEGRARERVLVLATDGQVGNEDQILAAVGAKASGVRIFTVGIDTAVNDAFLRRLAAVGGGSCEVVESEDRLDEVMDRIHRRIGTPVLTGVAVTGAGLDIDAGSLAPARIGALHAEAPLTVLGRYRGEATGAVRVTATDASGKRWSTEVTLAEGGSTALTSVWARARIRDLEDRYVVSPDPATEQEIVRTSLDGGVLSRFTAFVAVDVKVVNEGGVNRRVTQPVDAPHGWDMFGGEDARRPLAAPMMMPAAMAPPSPQAYAASAGAAMIPPPPPGMRPMSAPKRARMPFPAIGRRVVRAEEKA
ncbi:MAG TPA: VIT domain-containing protein, partial [Micromonosporaceae bacterium]|nr:VIT domain-containing protein [Micromonosporaceae bacterium]